MNKSIILIGLFFGTTSIILGAFGAHALKEVLTNSQLQSFETGVRYQMYHALFLLAVANCNFLEQKTKKSIAILAFLGVFLFSVSIYLLATQNLSGINFKPIGFVTPIGGLFLIAAWMLFGGAIWNKKS